jgi:DNA-binding CsgD family transcriptional regulator
MRTVRPSAIAPLPVGSIPEQTPAVDASRALARWINQERRARLIVTSAGDVLWMSAVARELIDAGSTLLVQAGRLIGTSQRSSERLHWLLASVSDAAPCWVLEDANAVIWALQIEASAGAMCIGLTIRPLGEELDVTALAEVRHLTAAEARVVGLMIAGVETGRIARTLDISVETLRTHVKHVYRKLGVNSRGGLVAKALPFVQP